MLKKLLVLIFLIFTLSSNSQTKSKLKWKDFLGTWESKDTFTPKEGKNQLNFVKQKTYSDSINTIWKFFDGDSIRIIQRKPDASMDSIVIKWYYVKKENVIQLRSFWGNGNFFLVSNVKFDVAEMLDKRLRIIHKEE